VVNPAADVIIITWNNREQTLECIAAVAAQLGDVRGGAMITVVDNGSTDGSINAIRTAYPDIRLLPIGRNSGFTGGIAAGVARSPARNVVFLNNDAIPEHGWLASLVDAIELAPDDVLSIAGKIVSLDGQLIDFIGGMLTFDGHAFQNGFRYPIGTRSEPHAGDELLFACGGNMISRRQPYLDLGGFDDDYFAYLEDVDFGWRTWLSGGRVLFEPRAIVRHHSSATSARLGDFERGVLFERNALQTAIKNFEDERDAAAAMLTCLHRLHHYATTRNDGADELTRAFGEKKPLLRRRKKTLVTIDDQHTTMQFRAFDWIVKNAARVAAKRAEVQKRRTRSDRAIFERFPLHFVPTYPGDEELLRNPLFALFRSSLPSVEKKLGDIIRT
jgi:GT2 family glycosyltransferase